MTGRQSLSRRIKLMPGNTATSAANTKVPAHRPNKLQATLPPRCRCRPMGQSFLLSNMCSQIASVHHHIDCVECSEIGAISQNMGKNIRPARMSNLTCSLLTYEKGYVPNLAPGSPTTKVGRVSKDFLPLSSPGTLHPFTDSQNCRWLAPEE